MVKPEILLKKTLTLLRSDAIGGVVGGGEDSEFIEEWVSSTFFAILIFKTAKLIT